MNIVFGQSQFQDTNFVIGDYTNGQYRALRKLDTQVNEITRSMQGMTDADKLEAGQRLANFAKLREEIIASRRPAYWEAGFEAAEEEYWVAFLRKRMIAELTMLGQLTPETVNTVANLPVPVQGKVMLELPVRLPTSMLR